MRRSKGQIFWDIFECLTQMENMASKDSESFWLRQIRTLLDDASKLKGKTGVSEEEVRDLCETIRSVSGSPDNSFWEYSPLFYDSKLEGNFPIPGTEKYPEIRNRLYALINEIRTVGEY